MYYTHSLSLRFNGHFPSEPGLAGVYWSKGWWRRWWQLDYWSYKLCKAPVKSSPPGRMSFLSPNQQCQSTEGKNITFNGIAYPKLTWGLPTLSLTTNSSWLPWGRVAMPLISPLMPVPRGVLYISYLNLDCSELDKTAVQHQHFVNDCTPCG